ncbi:MAG: type II toxin-antitoxin system HicA family toxin [Bacteroidetes bacterium]|nr:type II toxin-antitoxin system HicA family toxin [Bacteroidota bacterium]
MSKLPVLKPREILQILKKVGFIEVRTRGSHLQLKKGNLLVTVPIHDHDLSLETLKSILRQARISSKELQDLL